MEIPNLLSVDNVEKYFPVLGGLFKTEKNRLNVLNGITLNIKSNEIFGLVGESGCGKSTLAKLLVKLLSPSSGEIYFDNMPLSSLKKKQMRTYYDQVQMVFQDPYASLNPRMKIKDILGEMLSIRGVKKPTLDERVQKIILDVELDASALNKYPHEFSGGQRQRIAIARALIVRPRLLIADEPVSALDLAIQSKIIHLLKQLKKKYDLTILLVSHDLNLVARFCDRVAVMYLGKIMELISANELLQWAAHPYSKALLASIPIKDPAQRKQKKSILKGEVPNLTDIPAGCAFHPRCSHTFAPCAQKLPQLSLKKESKSNDHLIACHLYKSNSKNSDLCG